MHKGIAAYIVIGIILVVVLLFWHFDFSVGHALTTTTSLSTTTTLNTTTIPGTTVLNTTTTSIPPIGSCISPNKTVSLLNGNFSTGTYEYWNTSGYGFGNLPLNITWADNNNCYYNTTWLNYNGNFFATTYHCGIMVQTGNLTSMPFKVVLPYLNFKIISPYNNELYIEVMKNGKPVIISHYNTYNAAGNIHATSNFENASIPLAMFMCQNVSVRIVAGVAGNLVNRLQYIAVGDFYQSVTPISTPGIIVNQTII